MNRQGCWIRGFTEGGIPILVCLGGRQQHSMRVCWMQRTHTQSEVQGQKATSALQAVKGLAVKQGGVGDTAA